MSTYLDYAATSAVRPPEVISAVTEFLRDIGATPGRSGHSRSLEAGRIALTCRQRLAELLGIAGDPGRITFQLNATHALNVAIRGVLEPGDRVVRTRLDHNAVRRAVAALLVDGVGESVLEVDALGRIDPDQLRVQLAGDGEPAKLLVVPHASNVTGAVLPVQEMARIAREFDTLVLVDLAQTAGHYPVDVDGMDVDLAAFTGHKGLLGPQGIGGLWVREGVRVHPLIHGGTGGDSLPAEMPAAYPDHLEAGSQNAPGIAGLSAGVKWLLERGIASIREAEAALTRRLADGAGGIPGVRICSAIEGQTVGIVTIVHDRIDPGEIARRVERSHGIEGRPGLHCAPDAHAVIGTLGTGAFRMSLGWASTAADVDRALAALGSM